jgi:hypothetical protein
MNRHRTNRAACATAVSFALLALGCENKNEEATEMPESPIDVPDDETTPPGDGGAGDTSSDRVIGADALFEWPPLTLDASADGQEVVLQAPDPGWTMELDEVAVLPAGHRAYITIWRPEPGQMFAQVITERRADTGVQSDSALEVVARLRTPGDADEPPYLVVEFR